MDRGVSTAIEKFGPDWFRKHNIDSHTIKVLHHILRCRTSVMGGRRMACPHCGNEHIVWNSCGDRHCPNCQAAPREAWLLSRKEELLPVTYFHVVFTIPECLNLLFLKNKAEAYQILFAMAWETIKTFAEEQGIQIGMIALLHTWGSNLVFHPHIHCIVTGGGAILNKKNNKESDIHWKNLPQVKNDTDGVPFLFPVKALSDVFRAKLISQLAAKIGIDQDIREQCFKKPWVVYAKSPVCGVEKTLEYLTRYAYRVAISNNRIKSIEDDHIDLAYKDYRDNTNKIMTLKGDEFIARYVQHILPEHFVRIRLYGILAPSNRNKLRDLQRELGVPPVPKRRERKTWSQVCLIKGLVMDQCTKCKIGILQIIEHIERIRSPARILAYGAS